MIVARLHVLVDREISSEIYLTQVAAFCRVAIITLTSEGKAMVFRLERQLRTW